ncbi:MAG: GH3 auxin-responsive promoter family protein, partial [Bacteroidales bacterium]
KRKNSATMEQLKIISLTGGTFYKWMESRNKLGGQNKVPRLYSNSCFIDELITIK